MSKKTKTGINRKEYKDRWNKPLVNPPFTESEYEYEKARKREMEILKKRGKK